MRSRPGFSLMEMLVVVVLLGITTALSSLAFRKPAAGDATWRTTIALARREALTTGQPVSGWLDSLGTYTAFPTGVVLADSMNRLLETRHAPSR